MCFIKWVSLNKLRILVIYYLLGRNSWYGELQFLMGSSEVLGVLDGALALRILGCQDSLGTVCVKPLHPWCPGGLLMYWIENFGIWRFSLCCIGKL